MNKQQIQQQVIDRIYENETNDISGEILQQVLLNVLSLTSDGFAFGGVVNPNSYPMQDTNVFYLFTESGYYTNFNILVSDNSLKLGLIRYDSYSREYVYYTLLSGNFIQSVLVGNTITTEPGSMAYVTNSGTSKNVVLNFYIPRGQNGDQGPVGPVGPQGPQGQQGPQGIAGINPFKGWFGSADSLPSSPSIGDYAYVVGETTSDPVDIYECVSEGIWSDSGHDVDTSNISTFGSGQNLNAVKIDPTGLTNAASPDEANNPIIPNGMDVQQLAKKLEKITFTEVPVFKISSGENQNFYNNYKIQGSDGLAVSNSNYGYIEIAVNNSEYKSLRFIGYNMNSGSSATTKNIGYAFGHYNNGSWVTDYSHYYEATANANTVKEYFAIIPDGVTHFRTIARTSYLAFNNAFYLYLQKGDNVKNVISDSVDAINERIYPTFETKINTGVFLSQGVKGRIERSNSTWVVSPYSSSYAKHYAIQVVAGQKIKIKANSSGSTIFAFFTSNYNNTVIPTDGEMLPLADSLTYRVAPNSTMMLRVPEDAVWGCFNTGANGEFVPSEVSILYYGDTPLLYGNDIVDNIESFDDDKMLSANQGRILGNKLKDINVKVTLGSDYSVAYGTVSGTTGNILSSETNKYATFELNDNVFGLRFYAQTVGLNVTTGSSFYDENDNFIIGYPFPGRSGSTNEITEVNLIVPNGAKYFKTTIQTSLMNEEDFYCYISEGNTITEKMFESTSKYITLSNLYIYDNGNITASNKYVTTSPIYGGHGFYIELNEDYRIYKVVLFDVKGNIIDASYMPYNLSAPTYNGSWKARNWFSSMCILPQWYVKLVIKKESETSFSPTDGVIKEFCYLDDPRLSKDVVNEPYFVAAKNRLAQLTNLILIPKKKIIASEVASGATEPYTTNDYFFYPYRERSGVPYSEAIQYSKLVGLQVSPYTFLTAMHNRRSLMYTESMYNNHSEYGITYNAGGIHYYSSYFGIVCTALTGYTLGLPTFYHTEFYTNNGTDEGIDGMSQVAIGSSTAFDTCQLLDIIWYSGHCSIVSDIIYDEFGNRKFVVWAESLRPTPYITAYNKTNFNARFSRSNCRLYRLDPSKISVDNVMDSSYMQINWWDYSSKISYNDEICTFAGDKATFAKGDKIFVNVNPNNGWTNLEIYQNDNLIHTIDITSSQTGDIDLTSYNLTNGKYKARVTKTGSESDYTYFEVISLTLSYSISNNNTTISFGALGGTPISVNCLSASGYSKYIHLLTAEEISAGQTVRQWDYTYSDATKYIRLFARGDYGVAIKNVQIIL